MSELLGCGCGCVLYNCSRCIVLCMPMHAECVEARDQCGVASSYAFSATKAFIHQDTPLACCSVCPQIAQTLSFAIFRDLRICHFTSESLPIIKWHLLPLTPYCPSLLICSHGNPSHPQNIMVLILYSQCLNQHLPIVSFSKY